MTAKNADDSTQDLLQQSSSPQNSAKPEVKPIFCPFHSNCYIVASTPSEVGGGTDLYLSADRSVMLFQPAKEFAGRDGVQTAEAAVQLSSNREVTLIGQNYSKEPVELEEETFLGIYFPRPQCCD